MKRDIVRFVVSWIVLVLLIIAVDRINAARASSSFKTSASYQCPECLGWGFTDHLYGYVIDGEQAEVCYFCNGSGRCHDHRKAHGLTHIPGWLSNRYIWYDEED